MQLSEARNSVKISLAAIARQTIPPDTEVSGGIVCLEDVYLPRARSIASAGSVKNNAQNSLQALAE